MTKLPDHIWGSGWYGILRRPKGINPEYTIYIQTPYSPICIGWIERAGGDGIYVWYSRREDIIMPELAQQVLAKTAELNLIPDLERVTINIEY